MAQHFDKSKNNGKEKFRTIQRDAKAFDTFLNSQ